MKAAFIAARLRSASVRPTSHRRLWARIMARIYWRKNQPARRPAPSSVAVPQVRSTTNLTVHAHLRQIFATRLAPLAQRAAAPTAAVPSVVLWTRHAFMTRPALALAATAAPNATAMASALKERGRLIWPARQVFRHGAGDNGAAPAAARQRESDDTVTRQASPRMVHITVPTPSVTTVPRLRPGAAPPPKQWQRQHESSRMKGRTLMVTSAPMHRVRAAAALRPVTPARPQATPMVVHPSTIAATNPARLQTAGPQPIPDLWTRPKRPAAPRMTWRTPAPHDAAEPQPAMSGSDAGPPAASPPITEAFISARIVAEAREAVRGELHSAPNLDRLATDLMARIDKRLRIERERRGR